MEARKLESREDLLNALAEAQSLNEKILTELEAARYFIELNELGTLQAELARLRADARRLETQIALEREMFLYWLIRAWDSGHREGWEAGPTVDETMEGIHSVLCNYEHDPCKNEARRLKKKGAPHYIDTTAIDAAMKEPPAVAAQEQGVKA